MCPLLAGAGKMEAVIEKECSALGGLFQTIISDMKVGRRGRGCGHRRAQTSPPAGARPVPAPRPPATCGSSAARVAPARPGSLLRARLGHRAGGFSRGALFPPATSRLIVPGGGTVSFPWGLQGLGFKFFHCVSLD